MCTTEAEAIDKAIKESGEDYIDFSGMNCNDYLDDDQDACPGWDGESRRCFCGNRRVCWNTEIFDGKWIAYAEAY
jgi:hypothetical protein